MRILYLTISLLFFTYFADAQIFTRGYYLDYDSVQHNGHIAYNTDQNFFQYRENAKAEAQKLRPEDASAFVWGVDTFVVREEEFVRVVIGYGPVLLFEDRKTTNNPGKKPIVGESTPGRMSITRNYLLERPATGELIRVDQKKKKFIQQMTAFFADAPELTARIEDGEFSADNVDMLVREYREKYSGPDGG